MKKIRLRRGEWRTDLRLAGAGYCYVGDKSSDSSSSNSQQTNTTNIDRRQVVAEGGMGFASDNATINFQTLDAGIVKSALETVSAGNMTNAYGFNKLVDTLSVSSGADDARFNKMLDSTSAANMTNAYGFNKLADTLAATRSADDSKFTKMVDAVSAADATNGDGFGKLLNLAAQLFNGAGEVVSKSQDTALAQIAALNTAANDSHGAIDQKTIVVLAVAGAAALVLMKRKG